jgi:predicted  nucleic acid-binding Zn-ribbon protein
MSGILDPNSIFQQYFRDATDKQRQRREQAEQTLKDMIVKVATLSPPSTANAVTQEISALKGKVSKLEAELQETKEQVHQLTGSKVDDPPPKDQPSPCTPDRDRISTLAN